MTITDKIERKINDLTKQLDSLGELDENEVYGVFLLDGEYFISHLSSNETKVLHSMCVYFELKDKFIRDYIEFMRGYFVSQYARELEGTH